MHTYLKIVLMTIATVTLSMGTTSCNDDNNDDSGNVISTLYVPEKITSDNYSYTISYDNDLKIKSINTVYPDKDKYSYEIEYDAQSRIAKVKEKWEENNGSQSYKGETDYTYTYSENKLTVSIDDSDDNAKWIFTSDAEGKPSGCIYEDDYSGKDVIIYKYDAEGNLVHFNDSREGMPFNSLDITYDNGAKGISKDVNMPKLALISLFEISEDLSDILFTWNKSIAEINFQYSSKKEVNTYTYTNGSNGYPSAFKWTNKYGEETKEGYASITYKEIKK